jgi:hypothetical protein
MDTKTEEKREVKEPAQKTGELKLRFRHTQPPWNIWSMNDSDSNFVGYERFSKLAERYYDLCEKAFHGKHANGFTTCWILDQDNEVVAEGVAVCSRKDQFTKKIGRGVSFGLALKHLHETNPELWRMIKNREVNVVCRPS